MEDPVCNATTPGSTGTVTTGILRSILSPKEEVPEDDRLSPKPHRTPQTDLYLEVMGCMKSMKRRKKAEVVTPPYGRGLRLVGKHMNHPIGIAHVGAG